MLRVLILAAAAALSIPHALLAHQDAPKISFTDRVDDSSGEFAIGIWSVYLLNIDPKTVFSIEMSNHIGSSTQSLGRFTINAESRVLSAPEGMMSVNQKPFSLAFGNCFWGESFTLTAINTADGKMIARETFVPFPIRASDGNGHELEVKPIGTDGEVFEIQVTGFGDDEEIDFSSSSEGEVQSGKVYGKYIRPMFICPSVVGKDSGMVTVSFNRDLKVSWCWGLKAATLVRKIDWQRISESRGTL